MKLFITLLLAGLAYAQPPSLPLMQERYLYTGSNATAICWSPREVTTGTRATTKVAISAISKAAAGVVTSTGHGLLIASRPTVTISGATGTGWVSGANTVNGTFVATVVDADTFSIPVNTSGNGTLAGTVVFITTSPRSTVAEWMVQKVAYDGSNNATDRSFLAGSSGFKAKCSDATSTTVGQQ